MNQIPQKKFKDFFDILGHCKVFTGAKMTLDNFFLGEDLFGKRKLKYPLVN